MLLICTSGFSTEMKRWKWAELSIHRFVNIDQQGDRQLTSASRCCTGSTPTERLSTAEDQRVGNLLLQLPHLHQLKVTSEFLHFYLLLFRLLIGGIRLDLVASYF